MTTSKIIGWLIFLIGLGLIVWALYSSYNIFTNKTSLPEFFKAENLPQSKEKTSSPSQGGLTNPQDIQQQLTNQLSSEVTKTINDELKALIPTDTLVKILNLTVWSILAFIFISGGSQIATLGIRLINKN